MNCKKIMAMSIIFTTMMCGLAPLSVHAAPMNISGSIQQTNLKQEQDNEKIRKLGTYIELNEISKQYVLKSTAHSNLNSTDIDFITESINQSNSVINKQINEGKTITISQDATGCKHLILEKGYLHKPGSRIKRSIDTSKYYDMETFWWGTRVFLSGGVVHDIYEYNVTVIGAAGFTGATLGYALTHFGMASGPVGIIVAAFGFNVAYTYDQIVHKASQKGVYLDSFWGCQTNPPTWKIYAA